LRKSFERESKAASIQNRVIANPFFRELGASGIEVKS
jgi:hypothetical protein